MGRDADLERVAEIFVARRKLRQGLVARDVAPASPRGRWGAAWIAAAILVAGALAGSTGDPTPPHEAFAAGLAPITTGAELAEINRAAVAEGTKAGAAWSHDAMVRNLDAHDCSARLLGIANLHARDHDVPVLKFVQMLRTHGARQEACHAEVAYLCAALHDHFVERGLPPAPQVISLLRARNARVRLAVYQMIAGICEAGNFIVPEAVEAWAQKDAVLRIVAAHR